jgi:hypothetical protein
LHRARATPTRCKSTFDVGDSAHSRDDLSEMRSRDCVGSRLAGQAPALGDALVHDYRAIGSEPIGERVDRSS